MDTRGEEHSQWGFINPTVGWYMMEFGDEFPEKKNEETGKTTLRVPLKITEGDFTGVQQSVFIVLNPGSDGEMKANKNKVANILAATKLYETFEKKFPGDISILDPRIIKGMTIQLPGKAVMVRLDESKSKDGKTYMNIVEMAPVGYKPNGGGAKPSPAPKPAAAGAEESDW